MTDMQADGTPRRRRESQMMQGGDPPPPDPNIGIAANKQADTAAAQLKIAEDELKYRREKDTQWAPFYEKLANQQFDTSAKAEERADSMWKQYTDTFQPIEGRVAADATNWDSAGGIADARADAIGTTNSAFDQAGAITERNLARSGVSASSGRSVGVMRAMGNARALAASGAATNAGTTRQMQGIALRQQAVQTGRGIVASGDATSALGLNAGGAATGTLASQGAVRAQGLSGVSGLYSSASQGYGQSANTLNGLFGQEMAGYNAQQSKQGAMIGAGATAAGVGFGAWASTAAGAAAIAMF